MKEQAFTVDSLRQYSHGQLSTDENNFDCPQTSESPNNWMDEADELEMSSKLQQLQAVGVSKQWPSNIPLSPLQAQHILEAFRIRNYNTTD